MIFYVEHHFWLRVVREQLGDGKSSKKTESSPEKHIYTLVEVGCCNISVKLSIRYGFLATK